MIDIDEDTPLFFEPGKEHLIRATAGAVEREGIFFLPENAHGLVILAQGIEDATHGQRQHAQALAETLQQQELATFVVNLFSHEEHELDRLTGYFQQNTDIMQQRLIGIAGWFQKFPTTGVFSIGYFGMDEVGAAALIAAAERPDLVAAVVSTGEHVELARDSLPRVVAPTLLIAAEQDTEAVKHCQDALASLAGAKEFAQVPGVAALSTEPQAQADITWLASEWFVHRLIRIM